MWSGVFDSDKICWVDQNSVCKAKADGGLGEKNLAIFDASLLAKWRWRFLVEKEALWCGFLTHRYGRLDQLGERQAQSGSGQWQDLMRIDVKDDQFSSRVVRWIGNAQDTSFQNDYLFGESCLKDLFLRLFYLVVDQEVSVREMSMEANDHGVVWSWRWQRALFEREEVVVQQMKALLSVVQLDSMTEDRWLWTRGDSSFSMGLAYHHI